MPRRHSTEALALVVAVMAGAAGACRKPSPAVSAAPPPVRPTAASAAAGLDAGGHDPASPPIDCPLRKQGIVLDHLRPFHDTPKYLAFLERTDRAAWQKPDEVVAALGLKGSETVFDLGAGSGYFSFRLAKVLSAGKVIAADTEPEMLRHIHHRAMGEGVRNIEVRLIQPADPGVSSDVDLVFLCDVLHHVADRPVWLAKLRASMKSGARLALIEFKEGKLPEGPPEAAKIPRAELVDLVTKAGFRLSSERKDLLPYQVFLIFAKP
jgi:SAM-dependent methyltransferase